VTKYTDQGMPLLLKDLEAFSPTAFDTYGLPNPAIYEAAIAVSDIFHVAYGSLLPAVGSNAIESKPNVDW